MFTSRYFWLAVLTGVVIAVLVAWLVVSSDVEAQDHVYPPPAISSTECTAANQYLTCDGSSSAAPVAAATLAGSGITATGTTLSVAAADSTMIISADAIRVSSGAVVTASTVNTAGAVMETDYDAGTFLYAASDNTPITKTAAQTWTDVLNNPTVAIDLDGSSTTDIPGGASLLIDSLAAPSQLSSANLLDLLDGGATTLHSHAAAYTIAVAPGLLDTDVAAGVDALLSYYVTTGYTITTITCTGGCATNDVDVSTCGLRFRDEGDTTDVVSVSIPVGECGDALTTPLGFSESFAASGLTTNDHGKLNGDRISGTGTCRFKSVYCQAQ